MPYDDDIDEEREGCAPVTILAAIILGITVGGVGCAIVFYLIQP